MILIEELETKKIPGLTSLFIQSKYDPNIVQLMHQCDAHYFDKKSKTWEVPVTNLSMLLDSLCDYDNITLNLLSAKGAKGAKGAELSDFTLNNDRFKPFEHQLDAVKYGLSKNSWLLLDDPGLGKTLSMILLAQELKLKNNIKHCLIICGVNSLKTNWKNEIQKFSNLPCKILGERITKTGNVVIGTVSERLKELKSNIEEFFVITNIETCRSKDIITEINTGPNKFDMIIIDEIHTCKSASSQQGSNILKLTAPYKIGLTGTLLTNSPLDCYVPLKFIGVEHCNQSTFKQYYCKFGGPFFHDIIGFKNTDVLKNQLETCSLRRRKDLLNLPEKTIIHEFLDMDDKQSKFYKNIVAGIVQQVDKVNIDTTSLLSSLVRLRQSTACPSILTTEKIESCKINRALDLIEQVTTNNEKIVIFSTFKQTLYELQSKLSDKNVLLCTGDIKDSDISDAVEKFQTNDEYKIMLATWQKMGTGINLTAATYACFIDCPWTGALCEQAEDRIHRIGSNKPVFIYYLWANNTVDTRVKDIVQDKEILSDYIIDNKINENLQQRLVQLVLDLK